MRKWTEAELNRLLKGNTSARIVVDAPSVSVGAMVTLPGRATVEVSGPAETVDRVEIRGLPFPPSVNNLYANRKVDDRNHKFAALRKILGADFPERKQRGRIKTRAYRYWLRSADDIVRRAAPSRFGGGHRVRVTVELEDIDAHDKADADNCLKASCDLLVRHRIIVDDSRRYVKTATADWAEVRGMNIIIERVWR